MGYRMTKKDRLLLSFILLVVVCVLLALGTILFHDENVDSKGLRRTLTNVILPIVHLLVLYAAAVIFVFLCRSIGERVRWVEYVLIVLILALWSEMILTAVIGDFRKRSVRTPNPGPPTSMPHPENSEEEGIAE